MALMLVCMFDSTVDVRDPVAVAAVLHAVLNHKAFPAAMATVYQRRAAALLAEQQRREQHAVAAKERAAALFQRNLAAACARPLSRKNQRVVEVLTADRQRQALATERWKAAAQQQQDAILERARLLGSALIRGPDEQPPQPAQRAAPAVVAAPAVAPVHSVASILLPSSTAANAAGACAPLAGAKRQRPPESVGAEAGAEERAAAAPPAQRPRLDVAATGIKERKVSSESMEDAAVISKGL